MGFTAWLILTFVILIGLAVFAFARKNKSAGIVILTVMAVIIIILGYIWIISPM